MDISSYGLWITWTCNGLLGEAKLMRCEHEATLAKPTKDMLMGSTEAADHILSLGTVASLRHQSIININEIKDSTIT
jgi:hypothetical protein